LEDRETCQAEGGEEKRGKDKEKSYKKEHEEQEKK
jgi:hypothetical protein